MPPIYMDLHVVPGVNAKDVADAHSMDVLMEKEHSCKCLTYWIDELRGFVFCLIDAPDKESVIELHTRAHGLVPNKIIEVESGLVQAFLGRITDPESARHTENGLVIIDDTSYRVVMHIQTGDRLLMQEEVAGKGSIQVQNDFLHTVTETVLRHQGQVVEATSGEIIASFVGGLQAFEAAASLARTGGEGGGLRIGLHAGEPVSRSDKLFGDTVQLLRRMNTFERDVPMIITPGVLELLPAGMREARAEKVAALTAGDEEFISSWFESLEAGYANESFDLQTCCRDMGISQSQLYRKTSRIFGDSPNNLLRKYRLHRSKELLRTSGMTVSQVSFETGFSSASYFTKCFKGVYGILPLTYLERARLLAG